MMKQNMRALYDLSGKTALVTGGAGFLGQGFCQGYAEFGAQVAVVDIDAEAAEHVANILEKEYGCRALGVPCDVSLPEDVERMAETVQAKMGVVDILHNNAANQGAGLAGSLSGLEGCLIEDWDRVLSVDVTGMFLVGRSIGSAMAQRGKGSIIQTSSIYGAFGSDNRIYDDLEVNGEPMSNPAVYSTGKGAILALTRHFATYWGKQGVRVNALVPGGVEDGQSEEFKRRYGNRVPLGRMAYRHEIVGAALFLASDASSYITGQHLFVDGGLSAW